MELAQKILLLRKAKGYTQESLAQATNLSLSTIKRIENGKVNPRLHTLKVLSIILEVELLSQEINLVTKINTKDNTLLFKLLSILFTLVPPLNIFFSFTILKKKEQRCINLIVEKLLKFQILSFIALILSILLIPVLSYILTGQKMPGQINIPFIFYGVFIILNSIVIIYHNEKQKQEKPLK